MKVFYINLEKRKDRKDHMEKMLSDLNLDYERFEAIRPTIDELKLGKYKKFYEKLVPRFKKYTNTELTHPRVLGNFGCYISHLRIHESQLNNSKPYIILEDDVKITTKTLTKLNQFISDVDYMDWDIIRSMWGSRDAEFVKIRGVHIESKFSDQHPTHKIFGGSHFSVFKNANKIVGYMSSENTFSPDSLYSTCMLNVYHQKFDVSLMNMGSNIPKIELDK
jgi:GR25 family glycosyltransferase involved in LPS biosynthesis